MDLPLPPLSVVVIAIVLGACGAGADGTPVDLPGASGGTGFDEIVYFPLLHRVVVPAGRTGNIYLVDPDSLEVTTISGFSHSDYWDQRAEFGTASVAYGRGFLFATDRSASVLSVIDPIAHQIVGSVIESSEIDIVRYIAQTNEIWATELSENRAEVFVLPQTAPFNPVSVGYVPLNDTDPQAYGPEDLTVDATRGRVYTTHFYPAVGQSCTVYSIDPVARSVVEQWPTTCISGRNLRLDETNGFLLATCGEGTAVVLDVVHGGRIVSQVMTPTTDPDVTGYSASLRHLYLTGYGDSIGSILGVSRSGQLSLLGTFKSPTDSGVVTADDRGNIWMADRIEGRLWRLSDPYPVSE